MKKTTKFDSMTHVETFLGLNFYHDGKKFYMAHPNSGEEIANNRSLEQLKNLAYDYSY